jgi:hypothetical protein
LRKLGWQDEGNSSGRLAEPMLTSIDAKVRLQVFEKDFRLEMGGASAVGRNHLVESMESNWKIETLAKPRYSI